ncbi:MT-A70 family methyltransferase [Candidatus Nitrosocaldus cavascurensis]|uniref:MT-A70 family methyltransferase n=1 Tax=Candidatus Nitrosocaldus cavascurensis TaxID=2058097 RepID=UPI001E63DA80|nr:MT-A70 family methyltransferase [Candidatus Nitrosocaldus cavascurensis]
MQHIPIQHIINTNSQHVSSIQHIPIQHIPTSEIIESEEYKALLPIISEEEYNALKSSIEREGIRLPLVINPKKVLLDGYTRLRIAKELGIEKVPIAMVDTASEIEEKELILTLNAYRRHLNTAQKVEIALKLLELEREKARLRQLAGLKQFSAKKVEREKVEREEEKEKEKEKDIASVTVVCSGHTTVNDTNNNNSSSSGNRSIQIVAKKTGLSDKTLWKGLKIKEAIAKNNDRHIAELWSKALRGGTSIAHVYSELRRKENLSLLSSSSSSNGSSSHSHSNNNSKNSNSKSNNNNTNSNSNTSNNNNNIRYNVILADPPWQYEFGLRGNADQHYPCLTLEEIAEVFREHEHEFAYPCILFLWSTAPKLKEALMLIDMLNFEYKTNMVWVKDRIGNGYYVRSQHELLLIAVKGKDMPIPLEHDRPSSVIIAERGEHSRKPAIVYEIIERMYPNCSYMELFARHRREGWKSYGLELDCSSSSVNSNSSSDSNGSNNGNGNSSNNSNNNGSNGNNNNINQ